MWIAVLAVALGSANCRSPFGADFCPEMLRKKRILANFWGFSVKVELLAGEQKGTEVPFACFSSCLAVLAYGASPKGQSSSSKTRSSASMIGGYPLGQRQAQP